MPLLSQSFQANYWEVSHNFCNKTSSSSYSEVGEVGIGFMVAAVQFLNSTFVSYLVWRRDLSRLLKTQRKSQRTLIKTAD